MGKQVFLFAETTGILNWFIMNYLTDFPYKLAIYNPVAKKWLDGQYREAVLSRGSNLFAATYDLNFIDISVLSRIS